jgi:hypothetical protein
MIALSRPWFRALLRGWPYAAAVAVLPVVALAQKDYSAGKGPEQLFISDCSACHASPAGLARGRDVRTLTGFLHQHYTTNVQWAALLANYLVREPTLTPVVANPAAPQEAAKGNERTPKSAAETLISKLRSYATAGQEAKPPSVAPNDFVAPPLRPSADAVRPAEPPAGGAPVK